MRTFQGTLAILFSPGVVEKHRLSCSGNGLFGELHNSSRVSRVMMSLLFTGENDSFLVPLSPHSDFSGKPTTAYHFRAKKASPAFVKTLWDAICISLNISRN